MSTCPTCRAQYPNEATTCPRDGERLLPDEAFSSVDPDLAEGRLVGEYRIERKLGEGGFGSVYRAVHPLIGKTAAIKVLNRQYSSSPQMVSRFIAEARAVNQIRHRNIIDIFSFGALDDGRQYYVMELLEGETCDAYIAQKGRLGPEEAILILRGIARALDAAHAAGIAHRDLKPENIFLVFDDDAGVLPKLLDFGIAKLLGESGMSGHKTRTGTPMGTPHYMSPEQCRGKNIDHRTDIYSFGILAHAMLTGKVPFDADEVMEILVQQMHTKPPAMSAVCPDLPVGLDGPVLQMLEKDPAARPESLTSAVDALAAAARDAGFAVQVSSGRGRGQQRGASGGPTPPGGDVGPAARTPGKLTPAQAALSEAKTIAQMDARMKTVLAAEAPSSGAPKKRAVALLAGGALALGLVGLIFVNRSGSDAAPPDADGVRMNAESAPAAAPSAGARAEAAPQARSAEVLPAASVATGPQAAPNPGAVGVPSGPAEIEVTVQSTPAGAEVFLGARRLGNAPGPFRLPRGDVNARLTVKAPGYKPQDVDVTPSANAVVQVSLAKAPAQRGRPEVEF